MISTDSFFGRPAIGNRAEVTRLAAFIDRLQLEGRTHEVLHLALRLHRLRVRLQSFIPFFALELVLKPQFKLLLHILSAFPRNFFHVLAQYAITLH